MNNLVQLIASYFVNSLWQVAVIGGAGWLMSRFLKGLGPRLHHLLWVTILTLAALAPAFSLLRSILAQSPFSPSAQNDSIVRSVLDRQPISNNLVLPPASVLTLFLAFLVVTAWSVAKFAWSLHCTVRIRREARPILLGTQIEGLWSHCKTAFSVKDAQLLYSDRIAGPVTIGFAPSAILVSSGFMERCSGNDILAALAHECAHVRRHDFQKNLLYEVGSLTIAYHPMTWFVKAQIARTREMICDETAARGILIDRRSYAQSLLRLAAFVSFSAGSLTSNAIGIFDGEILEERIMTMRTAKQPFSPSLKYGLLTASVLVLFSVAAGIAAVAWPIQAQSQAVSTAGKSQTDLACTYYDAQGHGLDGTCETHKNDKVHYFCTANYDMKISQEQSGCEWKVQRAKALKQVPQP